MRKEEYGLATVAFLILSLSFPPYFIHFLAASAIGGLGYLLRSLNEKDRENLAEFEKGFRKGYELEQKGEIEKAIEVYRRCKKILSAALGIKPSPRTEAIYVTPIGKKKLI